MLQLYTLTQAIVFFADFLARMWRKGFSSGKASAAGPVIVLVHGFLCNSGMWGPLRRHLRRTDLARVYTVSLDPFYRSIERSKTELYQKLARICQREQVSEVVLVGHSMGGVLSRIVQAETPALVQAAITIGAPHAGTDAARFVSSIYSGPARPDTRWLLAFNAAMAKMPPSEKLLNIWSSSDNIVYPQKNAGLGELDIQLHNYGHLSLAAAAPTLHAITQFIHSLPTLKPPL
jgi:triacylglycerol lipase